MLKVAKFGGTSLANAACFLRVKDIIDADESRRFVIPSAPGREHQNDIKITDLLYLLHETIMAKQESDIIWNRIKQRFADIIKGLSEKMDVSVELDEIHRELISGATREYAASRGEAVNGRILAPLLNAEFVDASEVIRFDSSGRFDPISYSLIADRCNELRRYVIPGYYGSKPDGSICTFSRGGSDVTGAIVANAMNANIYENWTDVSGFCMADPYIVPNARPIHEMTYRELRELSYMGASVLHEEAIFPVREKEIPINIKNTNDPKNPGTMIVAARNVHDQIVTGIAGKKDFTVFYIEKAMMNEEVGFGKRVLEVFERYGVSYEHTPSGIDTLSVIVAQNQLGQNEALIMEDLEALHLDKIETLHGICLIATVGQGMNHTIGTAARLFSALAKRKVNVRMIDQGSSEQNIIIGVDNSDFDSAIKAIYDEFALHIR